MKSKRLLSWLFLVATVIIDVLAMSRSRVAFFDAVIIAQAAVVAVWAVQGYGHRLARAGLLVAAICALAFVVGHRSFNLYSRALTFIGVYAMLIVVTTLAITWIKQRRQARHDSQSASEPLKVPLIELFGWTIIVALASFVARFTNVEFLERVAKIPVLYGIIYAVVPIALILFDTRFHMFQLVKVVLFLGVTYGVTTQLFGRGSYDGIRMVYLAGYIVAWLLVRNIENGMILSTSTIDEGADDQAELGETDH